jgi:branched-chain amino acid transport system ATP-binding protein
MLAIARGLLAAPKILILDEPSLGIAPLMRDTIFRTVLKIHKEREMTLLLVEQNAKWALSVSSRGYILENGAITLEAKGSNLAENEYVRKATFGHYVPPVNVMNLSAKAMQPPGLLIRKQSRSQAGRQIIQ